MVVRLISTQERGGRDEGKFEEGKEGYDESYVGTEKEGALNIGG